MRSSTIKHILMVSIFVAVACVALAFANKRSGPTGKTGQVTGGDGTVSLTGRLTQDKVLSGGSGNVSLALTMTANTVFAPEAQPNRHVDLVVVLDRSGSMQGRKIMSAKQAITHLLDRLEPQDRFALVSYANFVTRHTQLLPATAHNRNRIRNQTENVVAGGGTNLGAGLEQAVSMLMLAQNSNNQRKIILISDGLANQGVTDLYSLGRMASQAVQGEFAVSTVGVGHDFNEVLMTHIADHGQGTYTFLENPAAFADVFWEEFKSSRMAAATNLEIRVPLGEGISLLDAAGYPIEHQGDAAVIRPGSLGSGQTRKLYLTFNIPTAKERTFNLEGIEVRYSADSREHSVQLPGIFSVACVDDPSEALASIVSEEWEQKVLQDDYSRLKEEVAGDIRAGSRDKALQRIEKYQQSQEAINDAVKSPKVASNLEKDLDTLRDTVDESFAGAPAEVEQKRKSTAKSLQYESYGERRQKK